MGNAIFLWFIETKNSNDFKTKILHFSTLIAFSLMCVVVVCSDKNKNCLQILYFLVQTFDWNEGSLFRWCGSIRNKVVCVRGTVPFASWPSLRHATLHFIKWMLSVRYTTMPVQIFTFHVTRTVCCCNFYSVTFLLQIIQEKELTQYRDQLQRWEEEKERHQYEFTITDKKSEKPVVPIDKVFPHILRLWVLTMSWPNA